MLYNVTYILIMEIEFRINKMKKAYENIKKLRREYGSQQAEEIVKRINELQNAPTLYDISKLPQARLHPLSGTLNGHFAVDLKHPYRMILLPLNGEISDYNTITKIQIYDIKDYH